MTNPYEWKVVLSQLNSTEQTLNELDRDMWEIISVTVIPAPPLTPGVGGGGQMARNQIVARRAL